MSTLATRYRALLQLVRLVGSAFDAIPSHCYSNTERSYACLLKIEWDEKKKSEVNSGYERRVYLFYCQNIYIYIEREREREKA